MCRRIKQETRQTQSGKPQMDTGIKERHIKIIYQFCVNQGFTKTSTPIPFPLPCNELKEHRNNVLAQDLALISDYLDDFQTLKELMRAAKILGCEPFYQMIAAAIASWFRRRTIKDVDNDLRLYEKHPYDQLQLHPKELILAKNKFPHFLGTIEYP